MTEKLEDVYRAMQYDPAASLVELSHETNFVPGRGSSSPSAIFIGEAPGANENRLRKPFVGKSGQLLSRMLLESQIIESSVFITNLLKWQPLGNRDPLPTEIADSLPYLRYEVRLLSRAAERATGSKPVLVPLGSFAARTILGPLVSITKCAGQLHEPTNGWKYFPMFHPAYVLRQGAKALERYQEHFKALAGLLP